VLANRLSENPKINVLLIEAGGVDRNVLFRMPKGFAKLFGNTKYTWDYQIRPFGPNNLSENWPRGKVLGGSSSINGMVYNRGNQADYDELERLGNPGWNWDTILPIFKKFEDNAFGQSPTRGSGGPLHVSTPRDPDPLCDEIVASGAALGLTAMRDVNESDDERIGHTIANIRNGRRVSAARAFLHPVLGRPNLTVVTGTVIDELLFDGDKVVGVRGRSAKGGSVDYRAKREVILSLGSLATPKLLQRSGIGPSDVLRSAGIPVRLDRANVGARMREHRCFSIKFRLKENLGYNKLLATPTAQALTGAKYFLNHKGPLAAPAYDTIAFLKSRPDIDRMDAQLLMGPVSIEAYHAGDTVQVERQPGLSAVGYVLRPTAEGSVAITAKDPDAPLDIDVNYFGSEYDRRTGADLFRRLRELFAQEPIASRIAHETFPGQTVRSDEELINSALDSGNCGYHAIATAAMGPNEDDVVDSRLRVRGVDNLRVMDCSVLPIMVAGNLNAPMMAMAWHAADVILANA
jgi:choline dehydrogenase-like flavoprotein